MNATDLKEKKRLIIQELQLVEDEWILKAIGKLLDLEEDIDIEDYNKDLDISMEQFKNGEYKTQEQLEIDSKKW
ncbi:MAG TPA: hypothetical protein VLZ75_11070 [Chitinophagales bacterium]|nr:hypothetical protein [Chitinophagales bacterium]